MSEGSNSDNNASFLADLELVFEEGDPMHQEEEEVEEGELIPVIVIEDDSEPEEEPLIEEEPEEDPILEDSELEMDPAWEEVVPEVEPEDGIYMDLADPLGLDALAEGEDLIADIVEQAHDQVQAARNTAEEYADLYVAERRRTTRLMTLLRCVRADRDGMQVRLDRLQHECTESYRSLRNRVERYPFAYGAPCSYISRTVVTTMIADTERTALGHR